MRILILFLIFASSTLAQKCDSSLWKHVYNPSRLIVKSQCVSVTGTIVDATHGKRKSGCRAEADGDYHCWLKLNKILVTEAPTDGKSNLAIRERPLRRRRESLNVEGLRNWQFDVWRDSSLYRNSSSREHGENVVLYGMRLVAATGNCLLSILPQETQQSAQGLLRSTVGGQEGSNAIHSQCDSLRDCEENGLPGFHSLLAFISFDGGGLGSQEPLWQQYRRRLDAQAYSLQEWTSIQRDEYQKMERDATLPSMSQDAASLNQEEIYLNKFNYKNQDGNLVFEPICQHKVVQADAIAACKNYHQNLIIPPIGSHVRIVGTFVVDLQHGHMEIHPVTSITVEK